MKEDGFDNNPYLTSLQKFGSMENSLVIPICNKIEAEMNAFSESEKQEFLESMGMSEPGLNKVITSGYNILNLHLMEFLDFHTQSHLEIMNNSPLKEIDPVLTLRAKNFD